MLWEYRYRITFIQKACKAARGCQPGIGSLSTTESCYTSGQYVFVIPLPHSSQYSTCITHGLIGSMIAMSDLTVSVLERSNKTDKWTPKHSTLTETPCVDHMTLPTGTTHLLWLLMSVQYKASVKGQNSYFFTWNVTSLSACIFVLKLQNHLAIVFPPCFIHVKFVRQLSLTQSLWSEKRYA